MSKGLTPMWDEKSIDRWFEIFAERTEEKTVLLLSRAGEVFVRYARENGAYTDHTGNLRSSIGYIIVSGNQVLQENFEKSDRGTDRTTGLGKARQLAIQAGEAHPGGCVLICVAGMEYAASVEAMGKDVITCAVTAAQEDLRGQIQEVIYEADEYGR